MSKVVLAYSGGLDTSVILKWLIDKGHEVIAYVADVGQQEDFEAVKTKALAVGASKVYVKDLQREFVTDYIYEALKGAPLYEGRYLLGTALARPVIAKHQSDIARYEGAAFCSHGATGKGNDQVRFELAFYALNPEIQVIAPWRDPEFLSQFEGRQQLLEYAEKHSIPVEATKKASYSMDANLMHISYESGILEDLSAAPPADMFRLTTDPKQAPDKATRIALEFSAGVPVELELLDTGKKFSDPLELFKALNKVAGENGVGRIDIVENRYVGIKSRGVYETPAGTVLWAAHRDLETITVDREVYRLKESLLSHFAELIYNGYWFSPEMDFIRHAIDKSQESVNGKITLELYKGNVTIVSRESDSSLYNMKLSSMDEHGGYNQQDADGFIKINAVRLKSYGLATSV